MILDEEKMYSRLYHLYEKYHCKREVPIEELVAVMNGIKYGRFNIDRNVFCVGIPGDFEIQMYMREDVVPFIKSVMKILEENAPKVTNDEIPPQKIVDSDLLEITVGAEA